MTDEPGQYCACHPGTKREIKENTEGITISGVYCPHRRLMGNGMGWQSFCTRFIRISKGCEK